MSLTVGHKMYSYLVLVSKIGSVVCVLSGKVLCVNNGLVVCLPYRFIVCVNKGNVVCVSKRPYRVCP